jgi:hypothetical protein
MKIIFLFLEIQYKLYIQWYYVPYIIYFFIHTNQYTKDRQRLN